MQRLNHLIARRKPMQAIFEMLGNRRTMRMRFNLLKCSGKGEAFAAVAGDDRPAVNGWLSVDS